jgi:hypothetical protein
MPHSVAPINAAVYNKGKGAFRRPTVRRSQRNKDHKEGEKGFCSKSKRGLHDKITDKNPFFLFFVIFSSFVLFV